MNLFDCFDKFSDTSQSWKTFRFKNSYLLFWSWIKTDRQIPFPWKVSKCRRKILVFGESNQNFSNAIKIVQNFFIGSKQKFFFHLLTSSSSGHKQTNKQTNLNFSTFFFRAVYTWVAYVITRNELSLKNCHFLTNEKQKCFLIHR